MFALDVPFVARFDHGRLYRSALQLGKGREREGARSVERSIANRLRQGEWHAAFRGFHPDRLKSGTRRHAIRGPPAETSEFLRPERPQPGRLGQEPLVCVVLP